MLTARDLGRRAPQHGSWLLRDINLEIPGGSRLAVVGPTGSGKTLLLRALARLDALDAGAVYWQGELIQGDAVPRFRRCAIYLHQRPVTTEGTVEDNLRVPYSLRVHHHRQFSRDRVTSLLRQVGRDDSLLQQPAGGLSGGESQLLALLRAIQLSPAMLFLDEPTSALDAELTIAIERLVGHWFDESPAERAFVWVSHDRQQVQRVAERVIALRQGQLTEQSKPDSS